MSSPTPRREPVQDAHQVYDELAVGFALNALEPDDEVRFAAHLRGCARCEQALHEHRETLGALAHAAPSVEPPPALLAGIRAGVAAERRDAPDLPGLSEPARLAERRARRSVQVRRSHLLTAAAAVVAVLVGLGGWNAVLQRDNAEQGAQMSDLAAAVQALEGADTRTVRLAAPDGDVLAVAVVQDEQMSLVVDGLEPNDEDSVYVLWGQSRFGDVRAVATFDVESRELDVQHGMPLDPGPGDLTELMVTREQGRTAPPTTTQDVLVSGAVQSA